jgi:SAM-dependent methyltransferase
VNGWSILSVLLALLFVRDGFRLRARWASVPAVPPAPGAATDDEYVLWLVPGAKMNGEGQSAAVAYAKAQGLQVLDLIPSQWSTLRAFGFAQGAELPTYREDRVARGWTAGQGILVSKAIIERSGLSEPPKDALDLLRKVRALKQYAPLACGFAVAPGLDAAPLPPGDRFAILRELFHAFTPAVLAGQLALLVLTAVAASRGGLIGLSGLVALHLQPLLALSQAPLEATDQIPVALFAWPLQVWEWISQLAMAKPDAERAAAVAALRPAYQAEIAQGTDRLLEARSERCYVCGSPRLAVECRTADLIQHKPGTFTLERCQDCGHLFQNPRLSLEGLSFYYRDFYDGLGGAWLETVFQMSQREYQARAKALPGPAPKRWIDVGGGYGHFCNAARTVWPDTRFECLDMGSSVEEAVRRGWADAGHRGLLPELASSLAGQFDVVSMSHCMEHTRDPRAELAAARTVLAPGGTLLIDVPNPDCVLRKALGHRWLPYFQPQHQHMLSVANLRKLAEEAGLEVVRVDYKDAHTSQDFLFGVYLTLDGLSPQDLPWRPEGAQASEWRRAVVWGLGTPALALAAVADAVVRQLVGNPKLANGYRLVAKLHA